MNADLNYAAKAADVQALKISPTKGSIVLSVDEKTGIRALEQPSGWVRDASGRIVWGLKSSYVRHGTVNLFAAYSLQTGEVIPGFSDRRTRVDFLRFMDPHSLKDGA